MATESVPTATADHTVVVFRTDRFNQSEPRDYFINDCCFGDDVARWLIAELRRRGFHTADEPGQEDFGWYFTFNAGGRDHDFIIGLRPEDGGGEWIGGFERRAGLLASMFGARNRGIRPEALRAIQDVLASEPSVREIRWFRKQAFDRGDESAARPSP